MSETGPLELIDFLQHMPKVEIPCHLLGAIRRNTFLALRDQHQTPLSQAEEEAFYVRAEKPQGVLHILRALDEHFLLEAADLYRLTYEYLQDARGSRCQKIALPKRRQLSIDRVLQGALQ